MRQLWGLWLLVLLVACRDKAPADGALQVSVLYGSYTPGCVRVIAQDGQGHEGSTDIPRSRFQSTDTRQLLVAVFRKPDWGQELTVEVSSYESASGEECVGTPVELRAWSEPVPIPKGDFARVELTLLAKDGDGDTFIKKEEGVAGTDCDDGRDYVHPGAPERCSVAVDYDCNELKGCQDPACENKACDDGSACTTGERCQGSGASAMCTGQQVQCTQPTGACLREARCEPSTGQCVNLEEAPGTSCTDGNPCTLNDQCQQGARCAGTPMSCNAPPSACHESTGTCNMANGVCNYDVKPASASCDDAVACTTNDVCNGAGVCQGMQTPCSASSVCMRVTGTGCAAQNTCTEEPDPNQVNTACMINPTRSGVCRMQDGVCSTFPYVPSNFDPDTISPANIGPLTSTCSVTFNSENLTWAPSNCVTNPPTPALMNQGGTEMVLLAISSLNLGADLTLRGTRPVILAVYGDATLNRGIFATGTIVSGQPVPGAGGNHDCASRKGSNGVLANGAGGGGGGGGGGTAGAAGNSGAGAGVSGGAGGGAGAQGGASFIPLVGGCPGGIGGGATAEAGKPGAGGGAVQLSVAGTLTVNEWISASGGGGGGARGSTHNTGHAGGGGGGGSGGKVLLEANKLIVASTSRLTANGGGGGEGAGYVDGSTTSPGGDGGDGFRSSATPSPGGGGDSFSGGNGGAGGAGATAPVMGVIGESNSGSRGGGGGGGGAVGHIRLRSRELCSISNSAVISPTTNRACPL